MKKYKNLDIILLVDDDEATNYYNETILNQLELGVEIKVTFSAKEALDYLKEYVVDNDHNGYPKPGIIFLDINMPGMSGWDFLEEYHKLESKQKSNFVIATLTTSLNPDDEEKSTKIKEIEDFLFKPLSEESVLKIIEANFEKI